MNPALTSRERVHHRAAGAQEQSEEAARRSGWQGVPHLRRTVHLGSGHGTERMSDSEYELQRTSCTTPANAAQPSPARQPPPPPIANP